MQCLLLTSTHASIADSIQQRIEHMMYTEQVDIDGVPILADEVLAELYAARAYQPLWSDPAKSDNWPAFRIWPMKMVWILTITHWQPSNGCWMRLNL